jgi:hypothetical protein
VPVGCRCLAAEVLRVTEHELALGGGEQQRQKLGIKVQGREGKEAHYFHLRNARILFV